MTDAPTINALLHRHALQLTLLSAPDDLDAGALDRPIHWVHATDLADPTPFLLDGIVLLTTGAQFADGDDERYVEYVRRLTDRGVRGLGFGTEVVRDGVPQALADACRVHRLPLFEVPYPTPFIAVAQANAESVAAQAYARRAWALAAQRAVSLAALRPDGLGATIAELARQLGTWAGLFDASGTLIREHPVGALAPDVLASVAGDAGTMLRRGARAASSGEAGDRRFTLETLGRGGHLRGVVAVASGELDHEARGVMTAVIAMTGLALEQHQAMSTARATLRAGLLPSLMTGDPQLAQRVAGPVWGGMPPAPIVVAVADAAPARSDAATEWLELRAAETRGGLFYGGGEGGVILVLPADRTGLLADFAELFHVSVGVSDAGRYLEFAELHAQARTALAKGRGPVASFRGVAAAGILSALDSEQARALARARLAPLQRSDDERDTALVTTVRAWLEHDARIDAAAVALGVHRHTVRSRIGHAERLLGDDLSSFAVRAELWAALVTLR